MKRYHIQKNETGAQVYVNGAIKKGLSMGYTPPSKEVIISLINQLGKPVKILIFLLFITCHAYGQGIITCAVMGCDCSYPVTYNWPLTEIPSLTQIDWDDTMSLDGSVIDRVDTIPAYMHTRWIYIPGDSSKLELLHLKLRQPIVQELEMGKKSVYVPETNVQEGNGINQKSKVITYQIAMSDQVTEDQKAKIKQAIDAILYGGTVTPPPVTVIDTIDAVNSNFVPDWAHAANTAANWYGGTIDYSNVLNATATYQHYIAFTRVEIWGERKDTHGKVAISIDGGPEGDPIDLYSTTHQLPSMLKAFDVPMGMHTIKIRVTGTKNAASKNTYGIVDFYRFTR